jgi:hypothetical protein
LAYNHISIGIIVGDVLSIGVRIKTKSNPMSCPDRIYLGDLYYGLFKMRLIDNDFLFDGLLTMGKKTIEENHQKQ